jgi:hypothetical protein
MRKREISSERLPVTSKLLLAAFALLTPATAVAQFTGVVTPPKREAPTPAALQAEAVREDSVTRATLTDMKVWVDSAAASITAASTATLDSAATAPVTEATDAGAVEPQETTAFRDGVPAPNTASTLPLLGVIAFGAMGMGAALLWRKSA